MSRRIIVTALTATLALSACVAEDVPLSTGRRAEPPPGDGVPVADREPDGDETRGGPKDVARDVVRPLTPGPTEALSAGWSDPIAIAEGPGASEVLAHLDAQGRALVVWPHTRDVAPYHALSARRFDPASGWSEPERIADWSDPRGRLILVANEAGHAVVAWTQTGTVSAVLYTPTSGFAGEQTVALEGAAYAVDVEATIDEEGDALVVYAASTGSDMSLRSVASSQGAWGAAIVLQDDVTFMGTDVVDLARGGDGAALLVFARAGTDGARDVMAARGVPGEGSVTTMVWQSARVARTTTVLLAAHATVDGEGTERVVLVEADEAGTLALREARSSQGGAFEATTTIVAGLPGSFGFGDNTPRLATNGRGDVVVLWREGATSWDEPVTPTRLIATRSLVGGGFSPPSVVADDLEPAYFGCARPSADGLHVDVSDDGEVLVAFEQQTTAGAGWGVDVWVTRIAQVAEAPVRIAEDAASRSLAARIEDGAALIGWIGAGTTSADVYARTASAP